MPSDDEAGDEPQEPAYSEAQVAGEEWVGDRSVRGPGARRTPRGTPDPASVPAPSVLGPDLVRAGEPD